MPRSESPIDPDGGALAEFAAELRLVREKAGAPTYRVLAKRTGYSASTLSVAASGSSLPSRDVTLAYVQACGADPGPWAARWEELAADLQRQKTATGPPAEAPDASSEELADAGGAGGLWRWPRRTVVVRLGFACLVVTVGVIATAVGLRGNGARTGGAILPVSASGDFGYDETTGPGCDMVFRPGDTNQIAETSVDNSDELSHDWTRGHSGEAHWSIRGCSDAMLVSQPSTEQNPDQWQNSYLWEFNDVPSGVPCTFRIYIADSPLSKYNATYDWTNGKVVGDWVDANAFTVNQSAHAGTWYTDSPHTYTTGMAYLMLNDQRGDNPPSANATLTASEVRLTCTR